MQKQKILSVFVFLVGVSAIVGGYGIIAGNGLGMPRDFLKTSIFNSFFWPGIILFGVVGGTQIIASVMLWVNAGLKRELLAVAGFGLAIWIFVQLYIIESAHILQVIYFTIAMVELVSAMAMLRFSKK
ncbi:MAG TPA: hypothetical protein PKA38_04995 [Candidatus Levybacteria bacterium]|nr:hypothetical protein [Candidatus Levybacteria bacterium]